MQRSMHKMRMPLSINREEGVPEEAELEVYRLDKEQMLYQQLSRILKMMQKWS